MTDGLDWDALPPGCVRCGCNQVMTKEYAAEHGGLCKVCWMKVPKAIIRREVKR